MNYLDEKGYVFLVTPEGLTRHFIKLSWGIPFCNDHKGTAAKVTINPFQRGKEDVFFFYEDELVFAHIQNRELAQGLYQAYLRFFGKHEQYTLTDFIAYIVEQYFISEEKHTLPSVEVTEAKKGR